MTDAPTREALPDVLTRDGGATITARWTPALAGRLRPAREAEGRPIAPPPIWMHILSRNPT